MVDTSFQPDWFSKPGDTLLMLMERHELTSEILARKLGCSSAVVRGLLAGTVPIDARLASELAKYVGGTPRFWQIRQKQYESALSRAVKAVEAATAKDWLNNFPHRNLADSGWITHSRKQTELFTEYLAFFGVNNPVEWEERYADFLRSTAFRTSPTFKSKIGSLSVWLRQAEIEAGQVHCEPWNPTALRMRLDELRLLSKAKNPSYFLPRLRGICAQVGVAVVFVRAPAGCSASGATRFVAPQKAMVVLSFRYLSDDHFWFTFFHELGHLLLHKQTMTFIDGEESDATEIEQEANRFSEQVLIPGERREQLTDLLPTREKIVRFAYSVGVSPGIIVGQLQHQKTLRPNQMNYLKRRFTWEQIQLAVR